MREITKQDVTILQAYSSEFGKLPAKMKKYQKVMETTERLLNDHFNNIVVHYILEKVLECS